jgi:hypothetical protein
MIILKFWSICAGHLTGNSKMFVPALARILAILLNTLGMTEKDNRCKHRCYFSPGMFAYDVLDKRMERSM